jgi:hypothetical protein
MVLEIRPLEILTAFIDCGTPWELISLVWPEDQSFILQREIMSFFSWKSPLHLIIFLILMRESNHAVGTPLITK